MRHDIAKHIKQLNDLRDENFKKSTMDILYEENKEDIEFLNQIFLDSFDFTSGKMGRFVIAQHNVESLDAVQIIWDSYKKIEENDHKKRNKLVGFVLKDLIFYYTRLGFLCELKDLSSYSASFELVFELKI